MAEQFVPPALGERLAAAVPDWTESAGVSERGVLSGVPIPHGPDAHRTFHVATEDSHERRLDDGRVPPMESGFLDGTNASLLERGIDSAPLASFAAEVRRHYEDLAERIEEREPDGAYDRMYM